MIFEYLGDTIGTLIAGLIAGETEKSRIMFEKFSPAIRRYLINRNFEKEVDDMASNVYIRVVRSIRSPSYDRTKVRFRILLGACVKETIADELRKRGRRPGEVHLDSQPEIQADAEWEEDYRENLLIQALAAVKDRVEEDTWLVFDALKEGKSPEEIAKTFGRGVQWVYNAKKRVMKMLREECQKLDRDFEGTSGDSGT